MTRTVLVVSAFAIMSALAPEPLAGAARIVMRSGCSDDVSAPRLPDTMTRLPPRNTIGSEPTLNVVIVPASSWTW
jgi:hypothetical protein